MLDVAIVGAGPAGLAAATLAAERGLSVSLYDEQGSAGGQVYRAVTTSPLAHANVLDADYWAGAALVKACERSGARYVPRATVWSLARDGDGTFRLGITVGVPGARHTIEVKARSVILATDALERPMPVPGWTLPGVLLAGDGLQAYETDWRGRYRGRALLFRVHGLQHFVARVGPADALEPWAVERSGPEGQLVDPLVGQNRC